ncbi:MAG: hypothetical protein R6V01_05415 [Thermoplasmatota archaeon]
MTSNSCLDDAIYCPDVKCPRCHNPFTTWVWKDRLIFTCPDCGELGFDIRGLDIKEDRLPEGSFFVDLEWPCETDPDPDCVTDRKMLFIEDYSKFDPPHSGEADEFGNGYGNFTTAQKTIGRTYDRIIGIITERNSG